MAGPFLVAMGALIALSQVFSRHAIPLVFIVGAALAVFGGLVVVDGQGERSDGNDRY